MLSHSIKYSAKAFLKIDRNGDDFITKAELRKRWMNFFIQMTRKNPVIGCLDFGKITAIRGTNYDYDTDSFL